MTVEEFVLAYGPRASKGSRATVIIDWRRALQERWQVSTMTVPTGLVSDLGLVWYVDAETGVEVRGHDADDAIRLTTGTLAELLDGRWSHRESEFEASEIPPSLTFPAYAAKGRGPILMDGLHRTTAAVLHEIDLGLTLHLLTGPDDPMAFADLRAPGPPPLTVEKAS